MYAKMPQVYIESDRDDCIMGHSGNIIGYSRSRVVWSFGFAFGSRMAEACGCYVDAFIFVLTDQWGKELERHVGHGFDLPSRFMNVLNSEK